MSRILKFLKQQAVYWAPTGFNRFGKRTYADPVELACRWEDVAEEFIDPTGTKQLSKSKVQFDTDVLPGGKIKLAVLDSVLFGADVDTVTEAYEIRSFSKIPNLKATLFLRTAFI